MLCNLHRDREDIAFDAQPCPPCVEQETLRVEQEAAAAHFRYTQEQAGVPRRYWQATLDGLITATAAQHEMKAVAEQFIATDGHKPSNLVVIGPLGGGKTFLACGIANAFLRNQRSVRYFTVAALSRYLKSGWSKSDTSEWELFKALTRADLVAIDDVGALYGTSVELGLVVNLMDARYGNGRPTILLGNVTVGELGQSLGEKTLDRLKQGGRVLVLDWPSRRPQFAGDQFKDLPVYPPEIP